ncbi:hypothetical protein FSP39_000704 [Pinctada imbricata]|uniref:Uncharacterized protein n=1 Tax=Pinctada imbricata TaxID=66713 RepID=A0AA88Y9Y1_PINIB|nr:hypothetical protein FSP39_000704 [Pinctada imbricata]
MLFTGERLRDLSVVVAGNDKKYDQTCGHFKGPAGDAPVIHLKCPKNTCGRYVKLQVATSPKTYLHVCEVEVYGY